MPQQQQNLTDESTTVTVPRILTTKQSWQTLGVSRSTFLNGVASGRYPKPIQITPRKPMWRAADLAAFIEKL